MNAPAFPRRPRISGIEYALGTLRPIETLQASGLGEEAMSILKAAGLETFSAYEGSLEELCLTVLRKTLASSGLAPSDLDAVFFATETMARDASGAESLRGTRAELYRALHRAGAVRAYPSGFTFSGCANFATCVANAAGAVSAGIFSNIAVIAIDRMPADRFRLVPPAVAIMSDGAAACLVSDRPGSGFEIGAIQLHANLDMHSILPGGDMGRHMLELGRATRIVGEKMRARSGRGAAEYRNLIMNNYAISTVRMLAHQLGYGFDKVFAANIPRLSHVSAADVLINAADLLRAGSLASGDRLMAFCSGPLSWGMMELTYAADA